jgi:hypothetical protein
MRRVFILLGVCSAATICSTAQINDKKSVIIGSYLEKPNAVLALNPPDKNQGFLLPQLTTQERLSIQASSPSDDGLIVYDVTVKSFYFWKESGWVKGLGSEALNQNLNFDPSTQTLTLSNGNSVSLGGLKEIPSTGGNTGKFLTTDGVSLFWAHHTITDDQNLAFDPTTNRLTISKSGSTVDLSSLVDKDKTSQSGILLGNASSITGVSGTASGQVLKWNGTTWIPSTEDVASINSDGFSITGDGTSSNKIQINTGGVSQNHIADNAVGPGEIQTNAVGSDELAAFSVDTDALQNGSVTNLKLATNSVATSNILSGGNDKILGTNSTGAVSWLDRSIFTDNQSLTFSSNSISIDRGNSINLNSLSAGGTQISGTLNNLSIIDGSVTSNDLGSSVVTTAKISSGGNNKVLTTDGTGAVNWADKTIFTDDQTLSLTGNTLGIESGNSINLNTLSVGGQVSGTLNNLTITDGTVVSADIAANAVTSDKITDGSITGIDLAAGAVSTDRIASGGISKVLSTNALGQVVWQDQSLISGLDNSLTNEVIASASISSNQLQIVEGGTTTNINLNNLSLGGDVTGTLGSNKATRIQGNAVSPTPLTGADAGKIMVWDGTQWLASASTSVVEFYSLDPAQFATTKTDGSTDKVNPAIFTLENTYLTAFKDGQGEHNLGWIHLPHGATITEITFWYMDKDATRSMSVAVYRRPFAGANEELFSWTSTGSVDAINSQTFNSFNGRNIVDNSSYSYRVMVTFDTGGETWDRIEKVLQRFYGLRVKYTR